MGAQPPRRAEVVARQMRQRRSRRHQGRRARVILPLVALVLLGALWGGGLVAFAFLDATFGTPPDPHAMAADTMVYDRTGRLIADLHPPGETRIPVPLASVSRQLQDATVAVEDRNFWTEGAVDITRLVGAAWQDVRHRNDAQGGSTITEQLAKVLYLDGSRSIDRKLREFFIARKLDGSMSKQQILEEYLNDIYYGHGAYGIEAASHVYFGKPAAQLDLAQASMLAGLPNQPAALDPLYHPQAARARQQVVLAAMVSAGRITRAEAAAAAAEPLPLQDGQADNLNAYPMFTQRVVNDLTAKLNVDPLRAGLRVTTSLDSGMQDLSQKAVTDQVGKLGDLNVTDGALVAENPATGEILAYVGNAGPGFPASQIDMAAHPRQPGSTFKLFTYSTALAEKKVTMTTPIDDSPLTLPTGGGPNGEDPYTVHNYDLRYHGTLPVKEVLGNSLNIPAVKVETMAGIPAVVDTARAFGVSTLSAPGVGYGYSLTLGTYPVPLWEMAQAGTVLASGGTLHPAHELLSVRDAHGKELLAQPAGAKQVLDPGVAFVMNDILRTDSNRVMEFGAGSDLTVDGHLVAAKTGTTQDFRDNLTVGWTPHIAIATWVGNADNSPMQGTTGITGAAPIWHEVMSQVIGSNDDWQPPPADVHQIGDDWYLDGTTPATGDVHRVGDCRFWTSGGGHYWYCGPGMSSLPGDPGPGSGSGGDTGGGNGAGNGWPWPWSGIGNGNGNGDGNGNGGGGND